MSWARDPTGRDALPTAPIVDEPVHRLAGLIAREVDDLLTIILGYVELSRRSIARDAPGSLDLAVVQHAGERARALTGQLHTLSGTRVVHPTPVDLSETTARLAARLHAAADTTTDLHVIEAAPPAVVNADPELIEQIIVELTANAYEALAHAPGTVTIGVRAASLHDGSPGVALVARDTGEGMDPEVLDRCREPLFTTKGRTGGAGLGLAIVQAAVDQIQGELHIESRRHHGTTVTVVLPAAPAGALYRNVR